MKIRISMQVLAVVAVLSVIPAFSATRYRIDINEASHSVTNEGWSVINAAYTGTGDSVQIDGVTFSIIGAEGARMRGAWPEVSTNPVPDALLADFVFDDGEGQDVGMSLGGAGDLQEGMWEVKVYIWDQDNPVGYSEVFYRVNGEEQRVTAFSAERNNMPASVFTFYSDGVSAYDVFVRENNSNNRSRLCGIELRLLDYKIDINNANAPVTEAGWHGLDASYTTGAGSVEIDGVLFSTFSADASRLRGTQAAPNPDALLGDFVFDSGSGQAVGLLFGVAGDLPAAFWQSDLYFWDADYSGISLDIGFRINAGGNYIVGSSVPQSSTGPAFSHVFQSDGIQAYDMFTKTLTSVHAAYLNAVHLRALDDRPTDPVLLRYDMDDCSGFVSAGSGTQTTPEGVDFIVPHFTASEINSLTNWGMDVPPNVNANIARNSMDGYVWWSRGNLLPADTNTTMYTEFTCGPVSGYNADFSTGELRLHVGVGNWSTGTYQFQALLYRNDGGELALLDSVQSRGSGGYANNPPYCDMRLDLSSLGRVTSPVTFRLYIVDSSGNSSQAAILDTLSLHGVAGGSGGTVILLQ